MFTTIIAKYVATAMLSASLMIAPVTETHTITQNSMYGSDSNHKVTHVYTRTQPMYKFILEDCGMN